MCTVKQKESCHLETGIRDYAACQMYANTRPRTYGTIMMTWFRRRTGMRRFKDDDGTDRFRLLDALPPGHTTTLKRKKNKPLGDIYIYITKEGGTLSILLNRFLQRGQVFSVLLQV